MWNWGSGDADVPNSTFKSDFPLHNTDERTRLNALSHSGSYTAGMGDKEL